jgi:hypothetical protein
MECISSCNSFTIIDSFLFFLPYFLVSVHPFRTRDMLQLMACHYHVLVIRIPTTVVTVRLVSSDYLAGRSGLTRSLARGLTALHVAAVAALAEPCTFIRLHPVTWDSSSEEGKARPNVTVQWISLLLNSPAEGPGFEIGYIF